MLRAILFFYEKSKILNLKNTRKITYCHHNIIKTTYKFIMKVLSTFEKIQRMERSIMRKVWAYVNLKAFEVKIALDASVKT